MAPEPTEPMLAQHLQHVAEGARNEQEELPPEHLLRHCRQRSHPLPVPLGPLPRSPTSRAPSLQ